MAGKKIHIPARKIIPNEQGVIKITPEAMEVLTEISNETGTPIRQVASLIITQASSSGLIVYDKEE